MADCIFPKDRGYRRWLNALVGLMVKCSCLEILGRCWSITKYEVYCPLGCPLAILGSVELVLWHLGFCLSQNVFPDRGCWLLWLIVEGLCHICGNGTGANRKCRLLWLLVPFLCPALDHTLKFNCLILKSFEVFFLQVFNFRYQVVAKRLFWWSPIWAKG